jgi:hypothetical protein
MKIALAILGIALSAALLVSATMAAGLMDSGSNAPGGSNAPTAKTGASALAGKARIMPVGMNPLKIKGTGFVPGERVRVTETSGPRVTRMVTAGARGGFVVALPVSVAQRCGANVVAKGDKGSRAGFNLAQFTCAAPGVDG